MPIQAGTLNLVELTSQCGQVAVVNDHNHDRVTLSQGGVTRYTFKNNGSYPVAPGTYAWEFFHGARPNGNHGVVTVAACEPTTTTSTSTTSSTSTSTTSSTVAPTTSTSIEIGPPTTECQDHTLACAGPPVTFPVHPINHATTTTSTTAPRPVPAALPFTGFDVGPLVVLACVLLALGALLTSRRSVTR